MDEILGANVPQMCTISLTSDGYFTSALQQLPVGEEGIVVNHDVPIGVRDNLLLSSGPEHASRTAGYVIGVLNNCRGVRC